MQVGERVYARKTAPHEWYKAYIIEIRPAKRVRTCICYTCCSKLPMEYVVMYEDQTTQIVNIRQISERL